LIDIGSRTEELINGGLPRGHSVKLLPNIIISYVIKLFESGPICPGSIALVGEEAEMDLFLVDPDLGQPLAPLLVPYNPWKAGLPLTRLERLFME
jgi:hypothetical protein